MKQPRSRQSWWWLAVCVWLLFLVYLTPAEWALASLGNMQATNTSGSLWQGNAQQVQVRLGGRQVALGQLTWRVMPLLSLRQLSLCAELQARHADQQLDTILCTRGRNTMQLQEGTLELPASLLLATGPVQLDGAVLVSVTGLEIRNGKLELLEARGLWEQAALHDGRQWLALGTLGFETLPADRRPANSSLLPSLRVFDVDAVATIDLLLQRDSSGMVRLRGSIEPGPQVSRDLLQNLEYLAQERQGGNYLIDL